LMKRSSTRIVVPCVAAQGWGPLASRSPSWYRAYGPWRAPGVMVVTVSWETKEMEARASPRKPRVEREARSS